MEGADSLCQKSRMPRLKSLGVTRGVELCHHSDAPQPGVLDDVRHVLLGVDGQGVVPGSPGAEGGEHPGNIGECLVVSEVPVEYWGR